MPRGDKTGPMGNGSKTGRALGYCTGNNQAESDNTTAIHGRRNGLKVGLGNGYGRRMGFRHGITDSVQEIIPNVKKETLIVNQINILKDQLKSLEQQLTELKNK